MLSCPIYKSNNCVLKTLLTDKFCSVLFAMPLEVLQEKKETDCQGDINLCCYNAKEDVSKIEEKSETPSEEKEPVQQETLATTKVSVHKIDNPYLVKADVLVYPANIILNVDDDLLNRMSRGKIQAELDQFNKPIKMGSVYITSNGDVNSQVKPEKIYHAVVAGESRLVNEIDMKSAIRKSLRLANENKARNVVILPCDCGTHDIFDTARVQMSSIKTFIQTEKNLNLKNIFVVMEDKESFEVYEEYYNRIFV